MEVQRETWYITLRYITLYIHTSLSLMLVALSRMELFSLGL